MALKVPPHEPTHPLLAKKTLALQEGYLYLFSFESCFFIFRYRILLWPLGFYGGGDMKFNVHSKQVDINGEKYNLMYLFFCLIFFSHFF